MPLLREQMPKHLTEKIVDHLKIEAHASVQDVLTTSLEAMQRENERTDHEKVDAAIGGYRAGASASSGPEERWTRWSRARWTSC